MFANFVLLLGVAIGLAGLIALSVIYALRWVAQNPVILIGVAIGAVVATIATIKVKNAQDADLVRDYRRRQARQTDSEPIARPEKQAQSISAEIDIEGLCAALTRLGYTASEAKRTIKQIISENPDTAEADIVEAAIHVLSDDKVRG